MQEDRERKKVFDEKMNKEYNIHKDIRLSDYRWVERGKS